MLSALELATKLQHCSLPQESESGHPSISVRFRHLHLQGAKVGAGRVVVQQPVQLRHRARHLRGKQS